MRNLWIFYIGPFFHAPKYITGQQIKAKSKEREYLGCRPDGYIACHLIISAVNLL